MNNSNKRRVEEFFTLSNAGETDACFALFSDDLVWTDMGTSRFAGTYRGKHAVMTQLLGPLFASLEGGITMEIEDMIGEGDKVVVQARGSAKTRDGQEYNNVYCQVFTLRDNKIIEVVEYCDTALIQQVLG